MVTIGDNMGLRKKECRRILYVKTNEIGLLDIPRVLDELGYDVYEANFELAAQKYESEKANKIKRALKEFIVDYVITYDFIITVSQVCMEAGIPYISWIYDAPQMELYMHYAQYPCNYVCSFDKKQVQRLKDIGLKHVLYVPLAVHSAKINMLTDKLEKETRQKYENDVTFIGQLYKMQNLSAIYEKLTDDVRRQLDKNIENNFLKWDKNLHFHGQMSSECVEELIKNDTRRIKDLCPYMTEQFFYEAAFLSRIVANKERVYVLNKLAEKYNVFFYTKDEDISQLSKKVNIKPGVNYDVLTYIYKKSKINLNITLHCIETGVPQRVLDVMAAGGFMLSNYQEELEEMFVDGEEIVLYRDEKQLEDLVEYYLMHEEERERIARKGQEKVLREYDFAPWLIKIFQYVEEQEENREDSYINIEAKELKALANHMLHQKEYLELYDICINPKYDTTIKKNRELLYLREMLKCWRQEQEEGQSAIFENIDTIQQAEQKYLEILHCLWRLEHSLSYESCMTAVSNVRKNTNSYLLVAWIIYTNILDQENTFIRFADFLAEYSSIEAVRFLNDGLRVLEDNQKLLVQQASYLLDLQLWEQALKVLRRIKEPAEDMKEIVSMLENCC